MFYIANSLGLFVSVDMTLGLSFRHVILSVGPLVFDPLKLAFLVGWLYLCMYSVLHIEFNSMIPKRHKPVLNVLSLLAGPFVLLVLGAINKFRMPQADNADPKAIKELSSTIHGTVKTKNPIELLDSTGKDYFEVYGEQNKDKESSREILNFTENIMLEAIRQRASDILIDPKTNAVYDIRFRIDGFLQTVGQIEDSKGASVVNSIKVISGMDIAERRLSQDGAFMARIADGNVFFRVASAGVLGGEKLSIRVLNQQIGLLNLDDIGLPKETYETIADIIKQTSGMVVVCGPTGSGKTTSLYAMLGTVDSNTSNIVTVEDPIEYVLANASQIEVNTKAGITFANALRGILRQDPDVICVGEIRDSETAAMALQASQTGHLVLATLHTNSNLGALVRLMDLGIKPLLLASSLSVIISQRLVRRLCDHCKSPARLTGEEISRFQQEGINPEDIMQAGGCKDCHGTGYYGRIGIFDVLYVDDEIKIDLLNNKLTIGDLKKQGDQKSKSNLRKEGMKKVAAGLTTPGEIDRVTSRI